MDNPTNIFRLTKDRINSFRSLIDLFNEVFDEYHTIATDQQLASLLNNDDFYAVVAYNQTKTKIIGGLTAYTLKNYYRDQNELYIYDIAIKTNHQRQGIGKQLIEYLKTVALQNGCSTIFVDAHSEDREAVKFWQSCFGSGEKVDHFTFDL